MKTIAKRTLVIAIMTIALSTLASQSFSQASKNSSLRPLTFNDKMATPNVELNGVNSNDVLVAVKGNIMTITFTGSGSGEYILWTVSTNGKTEYFERLPDLSSNKSVQVPVNSNTGSVVITKSR